MITQIDKETLDFLCKKKITFNQFCMCLLIMHKDAVAIIRYTNEIGFITGGTYRTPKNKEINELKDLLDRGFLKHDNIDKNDYYSLDNFLITEKFSKNFGDHYKEAAKEFWDAYPIAFNIKGVRTETARAVDYDEFEQKYMEIIKGDFGEHKRAMEKLSNMDKNYAQMKIMNFIGSKHWQNNSGATTAKVADRFY